MRVSGSLQNIEHIVLFMQENHSFDNYFGTRYGVNGFGDTPLNPPPVFQQRGWAPSPTGGGPTDFNNPKQYTLPFRLDTQRGPSISGQCINDPDHSWIGMHAAWNLGANNNWLPNSIRCAPRDGTSASAGTGPISPTSSLLRVELHHVVSPVAAESGVVPLFAMAGQREQPDLAEGIMSSLISRSPSSSWSPCFSVRVRCPRMGCWPHLCASAHCSLRLQGSRSGCKPVDG
jgi:hypothetical protein